MTTVSPLLSLFKEQLEAECKKLSDQHSLEERGHSLLYWYFNRLHDFTDAEVEEVFCDGGGDLGIDALWIDDDELVHFYQFKNPQKIDKGIPTGDVDKVISGLGLILKSSISRSQTTIVSTLLAAAPDWLPRQKSNLTHSSRH